MKTQAGKNWKTVETLSTPTSHAPLHPFWLFVRRRQQFAGAFARSFASCIERPNSMHIKIVENVRGAHLRHHTVSERAHTRASRRACDDIEIRRKKFISALKAAGILRTIQTYTYIYTQEEMDQCAHTCNTSHAAVKR